MRTAAIVVAVLLAGCQVSSKVVPAGRDSYIVSSHVGACVSCSAAVKGIATANAFCGQQGKEMIVRNTSSTTNPFGYVVGNDLIFSCVSKDDPEYTRPTLRKDNGVTTIQQQ